MDLPPCRYRVHSVQGLGSTCMRPDQELAERIQASIWMGAVCRVPRAGFVRWVVQDLGLKLGE